VNWRAVRDTVAGAIGRAGDRIEIEMFAARIAVRRRDRRNQVRAERVAALGAPASDAPPWADAMRELEGILAESEFQGARAEVVLSNHFVRYALLPWRDDLMSDVERRALARHGLSRALGAHMENWEISLSRGPYGQPLLAAAVDPALLAALRTTCDRAGLSLQSVEPFLAAGFNRIREAVASGSFWFAAVEPERVCLASIREGGWVGLCCQRVEGDWREGLSRLLGRELLRGDSLGIESPVYVCAMSTESPGLVSGQWIAGQLRKDMAAGEKARSGSNETAAVEASP